MGIDDFITITLGRGIGMGIVMNGQFYRGFRGGAGEIGHTVVDPDGPLCECGKQGCLEALVSEHAMLRTGRLAYEAGALPGPVESIEDLVSFARQGNSTALDIFAQAGKILGTSVANVINIFSPQRIIIGGEGIRLGDFMFATMYQAIDCHVLPGLRGVTEIRLEPWGDDAWACGAASLVLRELFESPIHRSQMQEEKM